VDSQLEQVAILSGHVPKTALADGGYRGVDAPLATRLLISHIRRLPQAAEAAAQAAPGG
jgi:transposase, IS5 family